MFQPLPTLQEIKNWVDEIITPELADSEAKRLCGLLAATSDPDGNPESYELSQEACRYAFTKTTDFEEAFRKFAGIPNLTREDKNEKVSDVSQHIN